MNELLFKFSFVIVGRSVINDDMGFEKRLLFRLMMLSCDMVLFYVGNVLVKLFLFIDK